MNVVFYSTGCPKCTIRKNKLLEAGIEYLVVNDVDVMLEKGIKDVPWLEVDGKLMDFLSSVKWINERTQR